MSSSVAQRLPDSPSILHLNYSDSNGGAARAAFRLHSALSIHGLNSKILVRHNGLNAINTLSYPHAEVDAIGKLKRLLSLHLARAAYPGSSNLRSLNLFPSKIIGKISDQSADIFHLHWINAEMLPIWQIARLRRPVVWTLHDMWPFCATNHYTNEYGYKDGYVLSHSRKPQPSDYLDRFLFLLKQRSYNSICHIVSPSNWLAQEAKGSLLFKDLPISVVPNPLDTSFWVAQPRNYARASLSISHDKPALLFGYDGASFDTRKGFDLAIGVLDELSRIVDHDSISIFLFGSSPLPPGLNIPFELIHFGAVHDDLKLRSLYSASDLLLLPSRMDNLPNIMCESLACSLPVIGFRVGGLPDLVVDGESGYLVEPFNCATAAAAIKYHFFSGNVSHLRYGSRAHALNKLSYRSVSASYLEIYNDLLSTTH